MYATVEEEDRKAKVVKSTRCIFASDRIFFETLVADWFLR